MYGNNPSRDPRLVDKFRLPLKTADEVLRPHQTENRSSKKALDDNQNRPGLLNSRILPANLQDRFDNLLESYKNRGDELDSVKKENNQLKTDVVKKESEISKLIATCNDAEIGRDHQRTQNEALTKMHRKLKAQRDESDNRAADAERKLKKAEEELIKAKKQAVQANVKAEELSKKLDETCNKLKDEKKRRRDCKKENEAAVRKLKESVAEIEACREEKKDALQKLNTTVAELESCREEKEAAVQKLNEIFAELKNCREEKDGALRKLDEISSELENCREEKEAAGQKLNATVAEVEKNRPVMAAFAYLGTMMRKLKVVKIQRKSKNIVRRVTRKNLIFISQKKIDNWKNAIAELTTQGKTKDAEVEKLKMDLVNMKTEFSTTLKINQGSFNANEEKIIRLELDLKGKCEQNKELAAKVAEMEKNSKSSAAKRKKHGSEEGATAARRPNSGGAVAAQPQHFANSLQRVPHPPLQPSHRVQTYQQNRPNVPPPIPFSANSGENFSWSPSVSQSRQQSSQHSASFSYPNMLNQGVPQQQVFYPSVEMQLAEMQRLFLASQTFNGNFGGSGTQQNNSNIQVLTQQPPAMGPVRGGMQNHQYFMPPNSSA